MIGNDRYVDNRNSKFYTALRPQGLNINININAHSPYCTLALPLGLPTPIIASLRGHSLSATLTPSQGPRLRYLSYPRPLPSPIIASYAATPKPLSTALILDQVVEPLLRLRCFPFTNHPPSQTLAYSHSRSVGQPPRNPYLELVAELLPRLR